MNKKGFLLYELFLAFTFIIIIMLVMLQTTINIKNQQKEMIISNEVKKANQAIYSEVGSDFKTYEVAFITNVSYEGFPILTGTRTFEINYINPSGEEYIVKNLFFDATNHIVKYDNDVLDLTGIKSILNNVYITSSIVNNKPIYKINFVFEKEEYNFNIPILEKNSISKSKTSASMTSGVLNAYNWTENIVRDSKGTLHVGYANQDTRKAYYIYSTDNGKTWSTPYLMYDAYLSNYYISKGSSPTYLGTVFQPHLLINSSDQVHFFVNESNYDFHYFIHRFKDFGGNWSAINPVGTPSSDEIAMNNAPGIDAANNIQFLYDRSHYKGFGYKAWNGSWSAYSGISYALSKDMHNFKTLNTNNTQYAVYRNSTNAQLGLFKRSGTSGVITIPIPGITYDVSYHDEVVDNDGNIWIFFCNTNTSPYTSYYVKYNVLSNTFGAVTPLDTSSTHVAFPSATVDADGNIYAFYGIFNSSNVSQIAYRVFYKASNSWSPRKYFTTVADGHAVYPKVRYQDYHAVNKNMIELTYRQNDIGSSTFNLYYGLLDTQKK